MDKRAIIQTQLYRELKALALFLIIYSIFLGAVLVVQEYMTLGLDFDNFSYIFVIYLAISSWILTSSALKLYTYHSYSRRTVLNRITIVQLIISFIAGLLIMLHTWLMKIIPGISSSQAAMKVQNIYFEDLVSNHWAQIVLTILFITLSIFCLLQVTNLVLIATYKMNRKTVIILLVLLVAIILGMLFSLPYWNSKMIGFSIMILGFVFGTGQITLPAVVIPGSILFILTVLSYVLSRKYIKKIEVYRNIFL